MYKRTRNLFCACPIDRMMTEIDNMISNEELMMNEALKTRALKPVDEMDSCVNYMEGVWTGSK